MRGGLQKYCLFFLLLSIAISLKSQEQKDYNFKHLSVREGLSNNTIQCTYQENSGKVWIGTQDGLNCYNGYEIKTYSRSLSDSLTLPGNHVMAITQDVNNRLWVGTTNGLCYFDPLTKHFHSQKLFEQKLIIGLSHSSQSDFFVSTPEGVYMFDPEMDVFQENELIKRYIGDCKITSPIFELSINEFFFMVETTPVLYQPEKRVIVPIGTKSKFKSNTSNLTMSSCIALSKDEYIIGNLTEGLFSLSNNKIGWEIAEIYKEIFDKNGIRALQKDKNDNIWIASYKGLFIFTAKGTVEQILPNSLNPYSISYQSTTSLLETRDGSVWVGTYFGGINIYRKHNNQFRSFVPGMLFPKVKHNSIRGIEKAIDNKIWMGTQGSGIVIMDPYDHTLHRLSHPGIKKLNIHALLMDPFGRMWIGTYLNGVYEYNFKTEKLSPVKLREYPNADISAFCLIDDNELYIGSMNQGVKTLHLYREGYSEVDNGWGAFEPQNINYISRLKNNDIAIGSENGLQIISAQTHSLKTILSREHYKLKKNSIQYVYEDSKENIWIGTMDNGIFIKKRNSDLINITAKNGLSNNCVYGIIEDHRKGFWASTNQGISRISKNYEVLKNYNVNDGLISNQFSFNAVYKSIDNQLFFGSVNGLSVFNPDDITEDDIQLTPSINKISVLNQDVLARDDIKSLKIKGERFQSMILKYEQRSFTFNFLAFYYGGIKKLKYRYRLINFNDEWRETNLRVADYTNIDPGKYKFEVEVLNPNGKWSEPTSVDIKILPVWYLSKYAFLMYFLFVWMSGIVAVRFMQYRMRLKNEVKLSKIEVEKTEEVNRLKLQFFTNISHEFRTPLTLISGPLESLILNEKNKDKKLMLEIANRNSNRLLRLVNNILDFRKAEQGTMKLKPTLNDIGTFIVNQIGVFEDLAEKRNISLTVYVDKTVGQFKFDAEKMETVMFNLLSNAFKFTGENGKISLQVVSVNDGINIILKDNGIGIKEVELPRIFDRFYQAGEMSLFDTKSSGIGLALVKEIVEKHQGVISVESVENEGATFTIFLPGESIELSDFEGESQYVPSNTSKILFDSGELPETSGISNGPSLLIIDDNKDLLAFLTHSLKDDYKIILAPNGQKGIELLNKYNPQLIITDVMMPQMDGIEFCQKVKNDIATSHIPLIMLSAKSTIPDQINGLSTGADIYITKPFSIEFIKLQINNTLLLIKQRQTAASHGKLPEKKEHRLSKRDQDFLDQLNQLIDDNIDKNDLSNDFLSEKLFVSTSTLYRKTNALTGKGINDYIRLKRLSKSKELIEEAAYSISEIAYMTGFNTPSYFSQCFKKEFGISPKEYEDSSG